MSPSNIFVLFCLCVCTKIEKIRITTTNKIRKFILVSGFGHYFEDAPYTMTLYLVLQLNVQNGKIFVFRQKSHDVVCAIIYFGLDIYHIFFHYFIGFIGKIRCSMDIRKIEFRDKTCAQMEKENQIQTIQRFCVTRCQWLKSLNCSIALR